MRKLVIVSILLGFASVSRAAGVNTDMDAQAINNSCAQEAEIAGCSGKNVANGLLDCLRSFKKEHPDFKISTNCSKPLRKNHKDRNM